MAIENSTFGVWDLDPRLDTVHYSPQWKARLGFPRIDAPDSSAFWRCRVHPDDFDPMLGSLRAHLDGCAPSYEMRFRLRSNGSGYRTMLSRGRVVARDELGHATRMVGTMVDLTGRPSSAATYGLAAERPEQTDAWRRPPFHEVLGLAHPRHGTLGAASEALKGLTAGSAQAHPRLVELIDDLLDIALREADGAR